VVLGRYLPQFSFLHVLLGDEAVLAAEAQLYQRLLAMDQMEAQSIVGEYAKGKALVDLYDSLLIPALSMAEQDRHKGAIDAAREEFFFLSISEMIAEFSGEQSQAASDAPDAPALEHLSRIICIPAHDRADEITASLLAQLLEQKGHAALAFPIGGPPAHELIALLKPEESDVVCISSLPPYAFAPARAMCKQIRERFPKLKVVVCVWGFSGDLKKAQARFERTPPERLSTSLAQALDHVQEITHPAPRNTEQSESIA
jgi:hypothetical protein